MLSDAELDACAELVDELTAFAVERIVADRPRADQIGTKTCDADWVTETDLAVERHVREAIAARFPEHRIVGEEFGASGDEEAAASWYVDPVDGTTNFVHALPFSSFSLVVVASEGAAAGAVADPYRREELSAVRGRGAFLNGTPTRCTDTTTLTGGIFLTELTMQSLWNGMTSLMESLAQAGCVTRILGSNALSVSSVSTGRTLATVIGHFGAGDCLAGALIAREAGARIVSSDPPRDGERFVCAAPGVAEELLGVLAA